MTGTPIVDVDTLRGQVRDKYRAVAVAPDATYHFHTGRPLAARLGYESAVLDQLPDGALACSPGFCADKRAVFDEIHRVLKPGGVLQFADIANGRPVPPEAMRDVDLWTG